MVWNKKKIRKEDRTKGGSIPSEGCFSDVRGPFRTKLLDTKTVHTSGNKFDFGCRKMSKNIFKVCSHIQKNTKNPNPIFKIAIYFTKTPKMPKYFANFGKNRKMEI